MRSAVFAAMLAAYAVMAACAVQQVHAESITPSREPIYEFTERLHFGTQQEILDKCNELKAWPIPVYKAPRGRALGCSFFNVTTKVQDTYNPWPKEVDDEAVMSLGREVVRSTGTAYKDAPEVVNVGHEIMHAVDGRYHD